MNIKTLQGLCDELYLALNLRLLYGKHALFVNDFKSVVDLDPDQFNVRNDSGGNSISKTFAVLFTRGGRKNTPSILYDYLIKNGAFEDSPENKRKYYETLYDILKPTVPAGGRKTKRRVVLRKTKRNKTKRNKSTRNKSTRSRKTIQRKRK